MLPSYTRMITDDTALILSRLESGFHANAATLKALEVDLGVAMASARDAGRKRSPSPSWNEAWQRNWDEVMGSVRCINGHLVEMGSLVIGHDPDRISRALSLWGAAQREDARLLAALRIARMQAGELGVDMRKEWNRLACVIEGHLETIHTSAQALRVKLELLKKHSTEEVEVLVQSFHAKLNSQSRTNAKSSEPFDQDYRVAVLEREQGQHVFTGFLDVVKGLSLWVESPDERMRKNRSLTLDEP